MPDAQLLPEDQVRTALQRLPDWRAADGMLRREYQFADFKTAWAFMSQCALAAEAMDHHPDWCNVWNRVRVELHTHSAGGVTQKDLDLASKMEEFARKLL